MASDIRTTSRLNRTLNTAALEETQAEAHVLRLSPVALKLRLVVPVPVPVVNPATPIFLHVELVAVFSGPAVDANDLKGRVTEPVVIGDIAFGGGGSGGR